jgi:hypothetical protein
MVWLEQNYNEPKYRLVKYERMCLKKFPRMDGLWRGSRVEDDRWMRWRYPGETGKWPLNRKPKRCS